MAPPLVAAAALLFLTTLGVPSPTPPFKWAERVDKVFVTVVIPEVHDVDVAIDDDGHLRVQGKSARDGVQYALDVHLFGQVDAAKSKWVTHRDRVDLTLFKSGARARWFQLLRDARTHPQQSTDWTKYMDYDDELDEIEIRSGARGVPVPSGDKQLKAAVDEYWGRKRVEERQRSEMPSLDEVTKRAEKEWEAGGRVENFQTVVQRLWAEMTELRKRERRVLEEEEDEWAGWKDTPRREPKDEP